MKGTFRPDRIRSIADRFGVNGDMALENILYGTPAKTQLLTLAQCVRSARAFNSEHQACISIIVLRCVTHESVQMELINECSSRFAEDKDFRLLVKRL